MHKTLWTVKNMNKEIIIFIKYCAFNFGLKNSYNIMQHNEKKDTVSTVIPQYIKNSFVFQMNCYFHAML